MASKNDFQAAGERSQPNMEVGVFNRVDEAQRAIRSLLDAGFTVDEITVVTSDKSKAEHFQEFKHQDPAGSHTTEAVAVGSGIGAAVGGIALATAAIATGGAALWIAGALAASAGGVAGGLIGAMMTRGVEKEAANYYQQAVLEGRILVSVEAKEHGGPTLARARSAFAEAGAEPLDLPVG